MADLAIMMDHWASLAQYVTSLQAILSTKFSPASPAFTAFTDDARKLLEKTHGQADKLQTDVKVMESHIAPVAAALLKGIKLKDVKAGQAGLVQSLNGMLSGSMPLPRSSKEELSNLKAQLAGWKITETHEQLETSATALHKLYDDALSKQKDVDAVELSVDGIMQKLMLQLHGVERLPQPALQPELNALESGVQSAGGQGPVAAVFSLALNAMQRLHAAQLPEAESEAESDESEKIGTATGLDEDDEDDPFFMPLPSAVLYADEKKFRMLAQPLGATQDTGSAVPMLQMDDSPGDANTPVADGVGGAAPAPEEAVPTLTEADFEPVPEAEVLRSLSRAASVAGRMSHTGSVVGALSPEASGIPFAEARSSAQSPASVRPMHLPVPEGAEGEADDESNQPAAALDNQVAEAAAALGSAHIAREQAAAEAPAEATTADTPAAPPTDEQHNKFVSFLQGQNPQACMFHAQMRLSLEGCRKLAMFLSSSSRVRALSLSHNFLGDDGMEIICEGLQKNTSVTTIDLPDNNISDAAVCLLAQSVRHNTSLTQLQLASNHIGDNGAAALANLIKANKSLKKLGLSNNNIGKAGCKALTEAISANKTLQQLQLLPGNPVEDKDAKALAKALQHSKKFSIRNLLGL